MLYTQEIGSIRKPRYLIEVYRRFLNGEVGEDYLKPYVEAASLSTIRMLEAAGLDFVFDGEMHRWEMYYHPVKYIDGIEFAGQVRVWDNYYFIKGRVVSEPKLVKNYHLEEVSTILRYARRSVKVPVTGPYTLAEWSFDEYFIKKISKDDPVERRYEAKYELALSLAKNIINPIVKELARMGVSRIQIDEPAATTHPGEMDIVVDAYNKAVEGVDIPTTIHICYSNYKVLLPYLNRFKTVQFTLEFANRDSWKLGIDDEDRPGYTLLKELSEYGYEGELGLGVVDVHVDKVEPIELIRDRIRYALKFISPDKLYINPDCGLRTRTRDIAFVKLRNMVEAAEEVRTELIGSR